MIGQPIIETIFPTTVILNNIQRPFTQQEIDFCNNNLNINATTSYQGLGNKLSSDHNVLEKPVMKSIKEFIKDNLEFYFREIICAQPTAELYITHSFLNYMRKEQGHTSHIHPNSYLSAVLYINADKNVDNICFTKSQRNSYPIRIDSVNQNFYNSCNATLPVGTGDLVIFPSHLIHGVDQKQHDNLRISLVCNTFIKGQVGNATEYTDLLL